jgi:hypothetical protein
MGKLMEKKPYPTGKAGKGMRLLLEYRIMGCYAGY